jgi:Fe-S cluster biosynthesis and repair protein YggX
MFNEEWWKSKSQNKEITVGWLYNNNIKDDFAKGYTKNMTDYWSVEFGIFFDKQFAGDTIFDLLTQAHKDGFSQIIVFKQGTTLRGDSFLPEFKKFHEANPDAKFIGHVLDRQEGYYEVHPQAFFIDLNWWAEAGFPEWGERTWDSPLETIVPIRSKENHHDQYTPHWIAPGKDLKTYQGQRGEGWNIVKSLIESGEKILSWSHECRVAKQYAYAEVKEDGPRHRSQFLEEIQFNNSFFIANTETIPFELMELATAKHRWPLFEQIVCPASGLTALIFAFKLGLKRRDTVLIYDVSPSAIKYTLKIFDEYDPNTSYIEFAKKIMDSAEGINFKGQNQLINAQELIDELNKEGFAEWKKEEFGLINIRTEQLNLFDVHQYKGFTRRIENKMTYIHLSNVFHYMPTSFYYSLQQRYELGRELLHKLHERSVDNNMLVYNADCNSDFRRINWIDEHIARTDFSELSEQHIFRLLKWNK